MKNPRFTVLCFLLFGCLIWFTTSLGPLSVFYAFNWTVPKWKSSFSTIDGSFFSGIHLSDFRVWSINRESVIQSKGLNISFYPWHWDSDQVNVTLNRTGHGGVEKLQWERMIGRLRRWLPESEIPLLSLSVRNNSSEEFSKVVGSIEYTREGHLNCHLDSIIVGDNNSVSVGDGKFSVRFTKNKVYLDSLFVRTDLGDWHVKSMVVGSLDMQTLLFEHSKFDLAMYSDVNRVEAMGDIKGSLNPLMIESAGKGELWLTSGTLVPWIFSIRTDFSEVVIDSFLAEVGGGIVRMGGGSISGTDSLQFSVSLDSISTLGFQNMSGGILGGNIEAGFDLSSERFGGSSRLTLEEFTLGDAAPVDLLFLAERNFDGNASWSIDSDFLSLSANGDIELDAPWLFNFKGLMNPDRLFPGHGWKDVRIEGILGDRGVELDLNIPKSTNVVGDLLGQLGIGLNWVWETGKAELKINGSRLSGMSIMDMGKSYVDTLNLRGRSLVLDRILPQLHGVVDASIIGSGPLDIDRISGTVRLRSQHVESYNWNIGSMLGFGKWDQGKFIGEIQGFGWNLKSFFSKDGGWEIDGRFEELVLRRGRVDSILVGGDVFFKSEELTKDTGIATFNVHRFDYYSGPSYLLANAPFQLSYSFIKNEWRLSPVEIDTPIGSLQAHGSFSPVGIRFEAKLPEITLKSFPDWNLSTGGAYLSVGGTPNQPKGSGWLVVKNLRVEDRLLGSIRLDMTLVDSIYARGVFRQRMREVGGIDVDLTPDIISGSERSEASNIELDAWFNDFNLAAPLSKIFNDRVRGSVTAKAQMQIPILRSNSKFAVHWGKIRGSLGVDELEADMVVEGDSIRAELLDPMQIWGDGHSVRFDDIKVNFGRYDRDRGEYVSSGQMGFSGSLSDKNEPKFVMNIKDFATPNLGFPEGVIDAELLLFEEEDDPSLTAKFSAKLDDWGRFDGRINGDSKGMGWLSDWTTPKLDTLTVAGEIPWKKNSWALKKEDGWASLTFNRMDLSAFSESFVDIKPVSGITKGNIHAKGLDSTFTLSGEVKFDGIQIQLLKFNPSFPLPNGRIKFSGRTGSLITEIMYKTHAYKSMGLRGVIDLDDLIEPRWDVKMRAVGLNCRYGDVFQADDIDADLSFVGNSQYSTLFGEVSLTKPLAEPVFVEFTGLSLPPPPAALKNPLLENMRLDVGVDVRSLSIDSELVQVLVSGGVGVGGTFYKPIFQGDASIEEGRVIILGRPFEMDPSHIVFDGIEPTRSLIDVMYDPLQLDPELDLHASTQIVDGVDTDREYKVKMSLEGSARRVAPRFQSTPELDFNRIVNLLAFGTTEIEGFNYGTALGAAAGQLLRKRVERAGIDEFSILPSTKIIGVEPGETVVRMGKLLQVPFSVWLRYEAALSRMGQGEIRLEHRLNTLLTLTGAAQSEYERYGIGIGLKKEF